MNEIEWYWISCDIFTGGVSTLNEKIFNYPPILKKFRGQPILNLIGWVKRKSSYIVMRTEKKEYK